MVMTCFVTASYFPVHVPQQACIYRFAKGLEGSGTCMCGHEMKQIRKFSVLGVGSVEVQLDRELRLGEQAGSQSCFTRVTPHWCFPQSHTGKTQILVLVFQVCDCKPVAPSPLLFRNPKVYREIVTVS